MCKITALDLGMCLPKCFVIVVNVFTFLLGSLIFGASIFGMVFVAKELGHGSLNVVFYGPIAFGGIIVLISFFGCCGACWKNRCMLMTFAILLLIIFACQVGVVSYVYHLYAKLNKAVNEVLTSTITSEEENEIFFFVWSFIQGIFECCGVTSRSDWHNVTESLPMSCCPMRNETEVTDVEKRVTDVTSQNATCTQSNAFEIGCAKLVTNKLDIVFNPLTIGVLVVLSIQLINVILSCCMFFVYGWERNQKRKAAKYGFVDRSPQRCHDQFIANKDKF